MERSGRPRKSEHSLGVSERFLTEGEIMAISDLNQRRLGLLHAVQLPSQEQVDRYEILLDCKEFAAIGMAVVHWSLLENAILQATLGIAEELELGVPDDVHQDSFRRRLAAYRKLVEQIPCDNAREYHRTLVQRISNANGQRQTLVHGVWDYDSADPDFLIVEKPVTAGKPSIMTLPAVESRRAVRLR